jgi:uncharacterized protein (DUF1015 family)
VGNNRLVSALHPFRALRPVPESVELVAAVPYDVVSTEEARALAADNPLSFLHVSRAEIDLPEGTHPYDDAVYAKAAANFDALKARAPLVLEESASLYVYRLRMGTHVQTGIAGGFAMDEYESGIIRKHEHTRRDKEDDRTRHMLEIRAQTGPVFLTFRRTSAVAAIVQRVVAEAPLFEFVAADGVEHILWRADSRSTSELVAAFDAIAALYIADGHHRAASAARARERLRGANDAAGPWDMFLAVAFPDDQVQILEYNRIVKDLGLHTPDTLMAALRAQFPVETGDGTVGRPGDVAMFLAGRWYTIRLGEPGGDLSPSERLDVSRLQSSVLTPMLGIGDVRSDKRIEFVGGIRGTQELESLVRTGHAAAAFALYPVGIADLMAVCDAGGIMPPKSTWFEPKLRDGLLSHLI